MDGFSEHQKGVMGKLSACRTEYMGCNAYRCESESCGHYEYRYASCKNRNCSVCNWLPREKWKLQRANDMIPETVYYHYVFTIPHDLSMVAGQNQVEVQKLLIRTVAKTLKAFEKTHCKGGQIGFIELLHTWSSRMLEHYHVHVIMPGGYFKDGKWYDMSKYMFPAKALTTMFRKKFCSGLRKLYIKDLLSFHGRLSELSDPKIWGGFMNKNFNRHWHVHLEPTRGRDPAHLIGYLSNYVYKTAIDHSRIQSVSDKEVVFSYRSHDEGERGKSKSMPLTPQEFLRRFSRHIQPKKFTRIRYYGFLAGGVKKKRLEEIFRQKGEEYKVRNQDIHRSLCEDILDRSGKMEPIKCTKCGCAMLSMWALEKRKSVHDPPADDKNIEMGANKICA